MTDHPRHATTGPSLDVVEPSSAASGPDRPHDGRRRWRLSRRMQVVIGIVLVVAWVIGAIVWHHMGTGAMCGCTPAP